VPLLRDGQFFSDDIKKANAEREAKDKALLSSVTAQKPQ